MSVLPHVLGPGEQPRPVAGSGTPIHVTLLPEKLATLLNGTHVSTCTATAHNLCPSGEQTLARSRGLSLFSTPGLDIVTRKVRDTHMGCLAYDIEVSVCRSDQALR